MQSEAADTTSLSHIFFSRFSLSHMFPYFHVERSQGPGELSCHDNIISLYIFDIFFPNDPIF